MNISSDSIWEFTIHSPQPDANTWVAQADPLNNPPEPGHTWVGANIAVTVRDIPELEAAASEPTSVGASISPVFVGSSGTVYDFWTVNYPASFDGESWNALPEAFLSAGLSWDKPFAIQVPTDDAADGNFAVRHSVTGKIIFFG